MTERRNIWVKECRKHASSIRFRINHTIKNRGKRWQDTVFRKKNGII